MYIYNHVYIHTRICQLYIYIYMHAQCVYTSTTQTHNYKYNTSVQPLLVNFQANYTLISLWFYFLFF